MSPRDRHLYNPIHIENPQRKKLAVFCWQIAFNPAAISGPMWLDQHHFNTIAYFI